MVLEIINRSGFPLEYATEGASGVDLRACMSTERELPPGQRWIVGTGISVAIPPGYEGQVRPRSGLMAHHGVACGLGTIDSDYRGEIRAILFNLGERPYRIVPGERIAQLVFAPVARPGLFVEVDKLPESLRGASGLGSTGR